MIILLTVTHPALFSCSSAASQLLCFSFLSHKLCFDIKRMSENVTFFLPLNVASSSKPIFNFQKFSLLIVSIFLFLLLKSNKFCVCINAWYTSMICRNVNSSADIHSADWVVLGTLLLQQKKPKKQRKHKFRLLSFQIRTIKRRRPLSWTSNKLNMSAGRAPSLQFLIWSGLKKKTKKKPNKLLSPFFLNSTVLLSGL